MKECSGVKQIVLRSHAVMGDQMYQSRQQLLMNNAHNDKNVKMGRVLPETHFRAAYTFAS